MNRLPLSRWWLAVIVLLGFFLRLYHLDWQSAHYDELFTLHLSTLSWHPMMDAILSDFVHPPLYY